MLRFRKNYNSQFGEDGIIEYLRDKLNLSDDGTCCEFGAWDGKTLSNTFHLVKNKIRLFIALGMLIFILI